MAVADVNGDGLDDLFIGGAKGQPGKLLVQQSDGRFVSRNDQEFAKNLSFKIVGAMPAAVRHGSYPARTPIGYRRVWPGGQEYSRRARPAMLEDDEYGPLVREHIFGAYGRQGWSMRGIVR